MQPGKYATAWYRIATVLGTVSFLLTTTSAQYCRSLGCVGIIFLCSQAISRNKKTNESLSSKYAACTLLGLEAGSLSSHICPISSRQPYGSQKPNYMVKPSQETCSLCAGIYRHLLLQDHYNLCEIHGANPCISTGTAANAIRFKTTNVNYLRNK